MSLNKSRPGLLDRQISKGKQEVSISTFALLFSEMVQYSQNRVSSVGDLHERLSSLGQQVGSHIVDLFTYRERGLKRDLRLLSALAFVRSTVWKNLFGREADKLELDVDDDKTYYIIEKESVVNRFISVPKDKGTVNCAAFTGGIIEAVLNATGFPCKVTVHWYKGTTYMIKFEESVITRDKAFDVR